jgi:hypothetical protein
MLHSERKPELDALLCQLHSGLDLVATLEFTLVER